MTNDPTPQLLLEDKLYREKMGDDQAIDSDDPIATRQLLRTLDRRLLPFLALLYLCSFLDRVNIGNAKVANLDHDLKMTPSEYNWSLSIFFFGYIFCELPSNMVLKAWRASRWLSLLMACFGSITMIMAGVTNAQGLLTARFFLGLSESGLFPGILYFLSMFYTRAEQATRIAVFFGAATAAGAFGGLIAAALSKMDGLAGIHGWQWIFIIEGGFTVLVAISTFFYLPDTPETAWFLTSEQRELALKRLARESSRGGRVTKADLISVIRDPKLYMHCVLALCGNAPFFAAALFLPTLIQGMGFSGTQAQLVSTIPYIVAFVTLILNSWHSDRTRERGFHVGVPLAIAVLGYIALIFLRASPIVMYAVLVITVSVLISHIPPIVSWYSNNFANGSRRAVALAMITSFNNVGGLIAGQFYKDTDAPYFAKGHTICAILSAIAAAMAFIIKWYVKRENARRERLTDTQIQRELKACELAGIEPGDWHPEFRYVS